MISRREFLKRAGHGAAAYGVGAAFPTIIASSALGRDGHVAPSNRIVMASIGTGQQGVLDLRSFLTKEGVQWVAVCDADAAHISEAKHVVDASYGNSSCRTYTDYRELLDREKLDAVLLACPDHWHGLTAIAAARKGLDIYGEKPLTHTLQEGRALCNAVKANGCIWQTGSWQRSLESFRHACELVRNGRIGKVHTVQVGLGSGRRIHYQKKDDPTPEPIPAGFDYDMWLGPAPWSPHTSNKTHKNWRWVLDYGGGVIMDWVGHHGDIAHWGMGMDQSGPTHIEGSGDHPTGLWNSPTAYEVTLKYDNGVIMTLSSKFEDGTKWIGDKGWVFVSRSTLETEPASLLKEVIGPGEVHLYRSTDHTQNFLDCVRSRQETITPAETAHRSASIGHLALIAMRVNRRLIWDPVQERFASDNEANDLLERPMRAPWRL